MNEVRHFDKIPGVPEFNCLELAPKRSEYALLIPVINEGDRILAELSRAKEYNVSSYADIIILDGGSDDGSCDPSVLQDLDVTALLTKLGEGRQGAQFRMGIWWSVTKDYKAVITIDGNNKDSIEDVPHFIDKIKQGYDFVQGSRFIKGGHAVNTPLSRLLAVKLLHAPIISLKAHHRFTDTTNAYRAYSMRYLKDERVKPLRDIFNTYELLAYLSVRATRIGLTACEIPVSRVYPAKGKTPTKISPVKGNWNLFKILILNLFGKYDPPKDRNA